MSSSLVQQQMFLQMQILRIAASFGAPLEDKKQIYISYVRSVLEQSCQIWNSRLTEENSIDLERVQKSAVRIILNKPYENYYEALDLLGLESLKDRREHLCLKFAKKCLVNEKTENIFPLTKKQHNMETRKEEKFKVNFAKTERYRKSSIPYMQRLMNQFAKK